MKIALSVGHAGNRPGDMGVVVESSQGQIVEAVYAREYLTAAFGYLDQAGHEASFYEGTYQERMANANRDAVDVFVAGHLNAGRGSYGLIKLDHRAGRRTCDLAFQLTELWNSALPTKDAAGNPNNQVWLLDPFGPDFRLLPSGSRVEFKTQEDRGFNNIANVEAPALLLEPLFLDNPYHLEWLLQGGVEIIGRTIAEAIIGWADHVD